MAVFDLFLGWIHVLGAVIFLGTMFVGTFVLAPVLKKHLDYEQRQKFIIHFIPRVRGIMTVVISILVLSGMGQVIRLYLTRQGPPDPVRLGVFGFHVLFAAVPVLVFAAAPRILGAKSRHGLCCDPDADDPPIFMGVMSSTGALLHYVAISAGWAAVLCAVVLTHLR